MLADPGTGERGGARRGGVGVDVLRRRAANPSELASSHTFDLESVAPACITTPVVRMGDGAHHRQRGDPLHPRGAQTGRIEVQSALAAPERVRPVSHAAMARIETVPGSGELPEETTGLPSTSESGHGAP